MSNTYMRGLLLADQKGRCFYCNAKMRMKGPSRDTCTIDHVIPKADGGGNERSNLVGACMACNNMRGRVPHWAFVHFVKLYGRNRSFREVMRTLNRNEFLENQYMWEAIRLTHTMKMVIPPKPEPDIVILDQPKYKVRRVVLHATRRKIETIVYGIPYYERNALWTSYLKKEKEHGHENIERSGHCSADGSSYRHDDGGRQGWGSLGVAAWPSR